MTSKFDFYFKEFDNEMLVTSSDNLVVNIDDYKPDKNIQEYLKSIGDYELLIAEIKDYLSKNGILKSSNRS